MHTACKVDPVYSPTTDTTSGYAAPDLQILGRVAPPVPGDAINRVFWPRTFTKLKGKSEGAFVLAPGKEPPDPFEDFEEDCDDPYEHLSPPHHPWPMEKQPRQEDIERIKSQITNSLLRGATETVLSPTLAELASRKSNKKPKAQPSGNVLRIRSWRSSTEHFVICVQQRLDLDRNPLN